MHSWSSAHAPCASARKRGAEERPQERRQHADRPRIDCRGLPFALPPPPRGSPRHPRRASTSRFVRPSPARIRDRRTAARVRCVLVSFRVPRSPLLAGTGTHAKGPAPFLVDRASRDSVRGCQRTPPATRDPVTLLLHADQSPPVCGARDRARAPTVAYRRPSAGSGSCPSCASTSFHAVGARRRATDETNSLARRRNDRKGDCCDLSTVPPNHPADVVRSEG